MDLESIKHLADQHRHELGFVLAPALARSIERSELVVAENGKGIIGFVEFHHRRDNQVTLYHIVVKPDHRYQGIGRQLIDALVQDAIGHDKEFIKLKCPANLNANGFYQHLGFSHGGVQPGRSRDLVIWRLQCKPAP